MATPVLLISADGGLGDFVSQHLADLGFEVAVEPSAECAPNRLLSDRPNLVIIDRLIDPHQSRAVCRQMRHRYRGPILLLSETYDEVEEILGSALADDYLLKPVSARALKARVRVLLLRSIRHARQSDSCAGLEVGRSAPERVVLNSLVVDPANRTVTLNGAEVVMSTAEFDLLYLLARHAGQVLSRSTICREIRGIDYDGMDRSTDLRVARLRRRLGDDGRRPRLIKSVHGVGYMLVGDPPSADPDADSSPLP